MSKSDQVSNERIEQEQKLIAEHGGPLRGRKFIGGKYRILELLGTGGMGAVYKVKHEMLDQIFAIKVLDKAASTEEKIIRRFDQEAKAAGALKHENLIGIHDYGVTDDGIIYIVMDYLEGTSLDNEIKRLGQIDEKRAIDIFAALCRGLSYAHGKGIIHRDLKPSNIMLTRDEKGVEVPKIVDFGIAKRQAVDSKLTQTGELFGTPLYMSPEQCLGYTLDGRSDIYSLGCVMFEALSGTNPFVADNAMASIMKHLNDEPPPLKASETVSAGMRQLVASCLEKDVKRRPQSADALLASLELVRDGKQPSPLAAVKRVRRKHLSKAVDVVLLIFIPIGVWILGSKIVTHLTTPTSLSMAGTVQRYIKSGEYTRAAELADKAIAEALRHHLNQEQQVELYRTATDAYVCAHQYAKAGDAAATVVEAAKTIQSPSMAVQRLIPQYELYSARFGIASNKTRSFAYLADLVKREREWAISNPIDFAADLYRAGNTAARAGYEKEAIPYFKQAYDLRETYAKKRPDLLFMVSARLTSAYIHEGDFKSALQPLQTAEELMPHIVAVQDMSGWEQVVKRARAVIDGKLSVAPISK